MKIFEVHLNNKLVKKAGIEDNGNLLSVVSMIKREGEEKGKLELRLMGSDFVKDEGYDWIEQGLSVNDEIKIRVIEGDEVDTPEKITKNLVGSLDNAVIESKLLHYRRLKEELKDYINK